MTHIFLMLMLAITGQDKPLMHREEVESIEVCERVAHEFNIAPLPERAIMGQAACVRVIEPPKGA